MQVENIFIYIICIYSIIYIYIFIHFARSLEHLITITGIGTNDLEPKYNILYNVFFY